MSKILLKNGQVFIDQYFQKKNLLIENEKIAQIADNINLNDVECKIIDCQDKIICPSFIDGHVHTRVPGLEYKEDIKHFVNACVHAGILDVVAMGNVLPCPDTVNKYKEVINHLKNPFVNINQVATVTQSIAGKTLNDITALAKCTYLFSDDGSPIWNSEIMKKIIDIAQDLDIMILLHEESRTDENFSEVAYRSAFTLSNNWKGLDENYESDIVLRDLQFLVNKKAHLHFQHLSTKAALDMISKFQKDGMKITTEITPHHLIFSNADIVEDDAMYKMNPPLGNPEWKDALIKGLNDGIFSAIVTDHAPHASNEKNAGFKKSAFGIIGIDTMFASLYTHLVLTNKVSLETIILHLTEKPAKLFLRKNNHSLQVGNDANIIIIDLNLSKIVTDQVIYSKAKNTPFMYKKLQGWVINTIKKGKIIF